MRECWHYSPIIGPTAQCVIGDDVHKTALNCPGQRLFFPPDRAYSIVTRPPWRCSPARGLAHAITPGDEVFGDNRRNLVLSIISSLAALYAAWNVDQRLKQGLQEARPGVHADEVQILLLKRNALVAAQLLDEHNAAWAKDLHQSQRQFQQWVSKLRSATVLPADEDDLLQRLERKWADLDAAQEKAIGLHMAGDREKARDLLLIEIRGRLSKDAYDLCEQLIASNDRHARQVVERADGESAYNLGSRHLGVAYPRSGRHADVDVFYRVVLPLRG